MSNPFGTPNKNNDKKTPKTQPPLIINAMSFLNGPEEKDKEPSHKQVAINKPLFVSEPDDKPKSESDIAPAVEQDPVDELFEAAQRRYNSTVAAVPVQARIEQIVVPDVVDEEEPNELRVFQASWQDLDNAEKASPERALTALNDGLIGVTLSFWHNGSVRATLKQHRFTLDRDHAGTVKDPSGKGFVSGVYIRGNIQILVNYRPIVDGNYGRIYLLEKISEGKLVL